MSVLRWLGVRLALLLAMLTPGMAGVAAEALRRQGGGFVICRYGGLVVPDEGDLNPLGAGLECPLFLVR